MTIFHLSASENINEKTELTVNSLPYRETKPAVFGNAISKEMIQRPVSNIQKSIAQSKAKETVIGDVSDEDEPETV